MGLFLNTLASVNKVRGLHGTAADPTLASGGGASTVKITIWYTKAFGLLGDTPPPLPTEVNKNSLIQTLSGLLPSVSLEYEVTRKEKLPSEASDYCNVCLLCCLLMHVVMHLCSYFYEQREALI